MVSSRRYNDRFHREGGKGAFRVAALVALAVQLLRSRGDKLLQTRHSLEGQRNRPGQGIHLEGRACGEDPAQPAAQLMRTGPERSVFFIARRLTQRASRSEHRHADSQASAVNVVSSC